MKECTFKPVLKSDKADLSRSVMQTADKANVSQMNAQPKFEQLYSLSKPQIQKTDKTGVDYEFERNKEECTFAPKLKTPSTVTIKPSQPVANDKHVQKQIDRMNKAREEKERKKGFLERGEPPKKLNEDLTGGH